MRVTRWPRLLRLGTTRLRTPPPTRRRRSSTAWPSRLGRARSMGCRRAAGGEVLVTRPVIETAGSHLEFEPIGEVRLKGFARPTELFLSRLAED